MVLPVHKSMVVNIYAYVYKTSPGCFRLDLSVCMDFPQHSGRKPMESCLNPWWVVPKALRVNHSKADSCSESFLDLGTLNTLIPEPWGSQLAGFQGQVLRGRLTKQ